MTKAYLIPDDGTVHHYTDTGGLIGIVQNKSLWATNIRFLNDSLEYDFGLQAVTDALNNSLERLRDKNSGEFPYTSKLQNSVEKAITLLRGVGAPTKDGQFICCFSKLGDDLSQWRGYAQEGYCISFYRGKLTEGVLESQAEEGSVRHQDVAYGGTLDWTLAHHANDALSGMNHVLHDPKFSPAELGIHPDETTFGEIARNNDRDRLAALVGALSFLNEIPFMKEDGFSDEQEMRICVSNPTEVKFRPSRIGPIPYIELPFNPDSIKSITVGPGLNIELRQATLEYLLRAEFGKDHGIQVKKTTLSFRG